MKVLLLLFIISSIALAAVITTTEKPAPKPSCPKNAEYRECTNICPPKSCENFLQVSACFSLRCGPPGCMCEEGHVLLTGADAQKGCVRREVCSKLQKIHNTQQKLETPEN